MLDRIHIEITNICNLQCSFCPEVERPKNVMDPRQFAYIIEQAAPMAKQLCLHLMGEPLLHPEIDKLLGMASNVNAPVNLTSNGLLLPKKINIVLEAKSLRQINLSLQSYKDNYPDKSLEQYLDLMLDQVDILREKRSDLYINLRLWNQGVADTETEEILCYLEKRYQISIKRTVDVGGIKSKKILDKVYLHFDSRFEWPSMDLPSNGDIGFCHALSSHIGIHADGTVVPCCLDKEAQLPLGNIFEKQLSEILLGDRAQWMLAGFNRGELKEELCKRCDYVKRFQKKARRLRSQ